MSYERRFHEIMVRRERVLLAIETWGAMAVFEHPALVRQIARTDEHGLRLIKAALLQEGVSRNDVEDLFGRGHPKGCACWRCVLKTYVTVVKAQVRRELSASLFAQQHQFVAEAVDPCVQGTGSADTSGPHPNHPHRRWNTAGALRPTQPPKGAPPS